MTAENTQTKVLLTGASGFIGSHTVIKLLEAGYHVRGTVRDLSRVGPLLEMYKKHTDTANLEFVQANLLDDKGWKEAMQGCKYVLHVASPVPIKHPKDEQTIIRPAKEGTLRVLREAVAAGVKRTVVVSSIAAICYGKEARKDLYTEADWTNENGTNVGAYMKSKTIAEKAAWAFMEKEGGSMEMTTVNPCVVLGPALEQDFGSSLELVKKLMSGEMPGTPKIGVSVVDVRDVADMILQTMTHEKAPGNRFIAAGEAMWISDVARELRKEFPAYNRKIPHRELPNWLVKMFAYVKPELRSLMSDMGFKKQISSAKAREILNWQPRTNEEAIKAAAQSLIDLKIV